jgi:hypothetical protein
MGSGVVEIGRVKNAYQTKGGTRPQARMASPDLDPTLLERTDVTTWAADVNFPTDEERRRSSFTKNWLGAGAPGLFQKARAPKKPNRSRNLQPLIGKAIRVNGRKDRGDPHQSGFKSISPNLCNGGAPGKRYR